MFQAFTQDHKHCPMDNENFLWQFFLNKPMSREMKTHILSRLIYKICLKKNKNFVTKFLSQSKGVQHTEKLYLRTKPQPVRTEENNNTLKKKPTLEF